MKGTYIGEFEELVLLIVAVMNDAAYRLAVRNEIWEETGRKVTLSTVHAALQRLESKGFVQSRMGEATKKRGGKRKKLFVPTTAGMEAIAAARSQRNKLWDKIPLNLRPENKPGYSI